MCSVELFYMLRLCCCCCWVVKKIKGKPFNLFEVKCRQQQGFLATSQRLLQILLMAGLILGNNPMCSCSKKRGDRAQGSNFPLSQNTVHWRKEQSHPTSWRIWKGRCLEMLACLLKQWNEERGRLVLVISAVYLHLFTACLAMTVIYWGWPPFIKPCCRCEMLAITSQNKAQTSLKFSQRGNSVSVQPEEGEGQNTADLGGEVGIVYPFLKDKYAVPACDPAYL